MQIIKSFFKLVFFIFPSLVFAQSTYLNQGSKDVHFVDRLEIKQQKNTDLNFSALRNLNRKAIVRQAEFLDSARLGFKDTATGVDKFSEWTDLNLNEIDEYNLNSLLMNSSEWTTKSKDLFKSKKTFIGSLYKYKANFLEVNVKDFFLVVNPVLQIHQAVEPGYGEGIFLNSRGATARGMIAKRIGFSTFIAENQERGPQFFQQQINRFKAVPGVGFYKPFKNTGVDYFDARGYLTFNAAKYIDFQIGYDKNFIGNGYRSLFLSDWGNSYLFTKINTRIWKFNYQNLFMELMPQFKKAGDTLLDRKYAAIHHLSMNVTKWLNIGLFEGVIFGRKNRFDFQYLNPIIFYRHIEGTLGSKDNAIAGLDYKANIAHRVQLYGQFLLDEFQLKTLLKDKNNWANKWALQTGVKYVDAFGVNNLDIQIERNAIRPYTYSHLDSIGNFTHYNQPMAHPLGANLHEYIGIIRYQPAVRWNIYARAIYYQQGLDSAGRNFGANPFNTYTTRPRESNLPIGVGSKATGLNGLIQVSYEWKENLFFDLSFLYRNYSVANTVGRSTTRLVTAGIRLNMFKREYDF
jgi:hypothetical protein